MGWTSYLEDIVERMDDDLARCRTDALAARSSGSTATGVTVETMLGWLANAERLMRELRSHLDLATDPDSNAAAEIIALERQNRVLNERRGQADNLQRECDKLRDDLKRLRKENRTLRERLDSAFKEDPGAIYDAYTSPSLIKKLKPDERRLNKGRG